MARSSGPDWKFVAHMAWKAELNRGLACPADSSASNPLRVAGKGDSPAGRARSSPAKSGGASCDDRPAQYDRPRRQRRCDGRGRRRAGTLAADVTGPVEAGAPAANVTGSARAGAPAADVTGPAGKASRRQARGLRLAPLRRNGGPGWPGRRRRGYYGRRDRLRNLAEVVGSAFLVGSPRGHRRRGTALSTRASSSGGVADGTRAVVSPALR